MVLAVAAAGTASEWGIDAAHSSVGFEVRHLVISKTKGNFQDFSGTVTFEDGKLAAGSAEFTIQVASIDTDNEDRDKHLKSPDFFDVEQFPTMTFKSTKVTPGEDGAFKLVGDLTIKDVTKSVTFDCEFHGVVKDPWGNTKAGFSAMTTIDRSEFNISFNKAMETGGLVVGNEVSITLELELNQKS
ncbi:MAG: YceI family protein [candidate division Zixibacteria bacterium]|nr:YceI family protein [candidate division Zixibacteria bacterium]